MKVALYARVSTDDKDQNPEVQLVQLREYCERMEWSIYQEYVDVASAVDYPNRTAWTQLMKAASTHRFDLVLVYRYNRAFRSRIHAHNTLDVLQRYKVAFRSLTEPSIDTQGLAGKIIIDILAILAEQEREELIENVKAGMAYAKEHGTRSGKPIGRPREDLQIGLICKAFVNGGGTYSEAARILSKNRSRLSPAFVCMRLKREAAMRGIPQKEFEKELLKGV